MAPDRPVVREWAPPIVDDPGAYRPSRLARYALSIADGQGIGRFVFMGHSWGGSIGVHLAADHPDLVGKVSREDILARAEEV